MMNTLRRAQPSTVSGTIDFKSYAYNGLFSHAKTSWQSEGTFPWCIFVSALVLALIRKRNKKSLSREMQAITYALNAYVFAEIWWALYLRYCGTFWIRDSIICHALLIRAMQVQLFVSPRRVVTYYHYENAEHLSAVFRGPVSRLGRDLRRLARRSRELALSWVSGVSCEIRRPWIVSRGIVSPVCRHCVFSKYRSASKRMDARNLLL